LLKNTETLLVTGAGGRLGGQIIELLLARADANIIATTRSPEKLSDFARRGVDVRKLDFDDDAAAIARAVAGADRMLMISTDDIGRRAEQIGAVVAGAKLAKVKYLLYTSAASPNPNPISAVVSDHFWSEHAIMTSAIAWTMLRHNMYTEHVLLFLPPALRSGRLRTSLGDGARAYVTRADCARADAAALRGEWTDCRIYDIGGPEALTTDALLAVARDLTGIEARHERVDDAEALREFAANGLPPGFPEASVGFDICARYGYHAIVSPAVKELCGIEPETVRSYLARQLEVLRGGKATVDV
jgi:NAD(P)H dehydrogenase (quinone)